MSGFGWAFVPTDCETTGHSHATEADLMSPDGAATHGEHHGHAGHTNGADVVDSDSAPACECCDACVTSCAFGASIMTASDCSQLPIFDAGRVSISQANQYVPPAAYPLLRPPIPTV